MRTHILQIAAATQENNYSIGESEGACNALVLYKALADQIRLQILRLLKNDSFGVLELCRIVEIRQSALSHHLKILANASLVSTRREGNSIFYRRTFLAQDDSFRDIKRNVFEEMDKAAISEQQQSIIKVIQQERSLLSLNFFNKNASKFREQQGLIVKHEDYCRNLHDVIGGLGLTSASSVMEVGPGEGELLVELAQTYQKLTALDNSKDMLDRARLSASKSKFTDIEFVLGDTQVARSLSATYDLIIFDMVLHHISSPAETFADCAELLNANGVLVIADLSPHDQDWVRESCGDLWLGFDDSDLLSWAQKANLEPGDSSFLGLRNGFQIQIRVFKNKTPATY